MAYSRYSMSRRSARARLTTGDLSLNSTAWSNVSVSLDLLMKRVQVGDAIAVGISAITGNEAVGLELDVVTVVSGSPVNSFAKRGTVEASPGARLSGWSCPASMVARISGNAPLYVVDAADLSNTDEMTLRLRYATSAAATRTLRASTDYPLDLWAVNIGPLQP